MVTYWTCVLAPLTGHFFLKLLQNVQWGVAENIATCTYFQWAWVDNRRLDNVPCYKAQIISNQFLNSKLKLPPESPDLNPTEQLWDEEEWEIHIMDNGVMLSCQYGPKSSTLWNLCHEELRHMYMVWLMWSQLDGLDYYPVSKSLLIISEGWITKFDY